MPNRQVLLSPEFAARFAVIDVGTNSIRLIIAESTGGDSYRVLDDEKETVRLGRNLAQTSRLDPEAVEQAVQALRRMKQIAEGYQARQIRAIATCAVREAEDGDEFCARLHNELGLSVEVISARQEAEYAFAGVVRSFDLEGRNVAVVDMGGGSTEIVLARGPIIEEMYGTPLGAVRVTEMFKIGQIVDSDAFKELVEAIDRKLRKYLGKPLLYPHVLIGSGGTFSALGAMVLAQRGKAHLPVQGCEITRAELRTLLNLLRKMTLKGRANMPGLSPDRADIIVGGLIVIDRIMRRLHVNVLQVHSGGVRQGLLLSMLGVGRQETPSDRDTAIDRFATRCGVDLKHGRHVGVLAARLFEQLALIYPLPPSDGTLVEISARLQDVGYLIDYDKHHKHSYHLIINCPLPGLDGHDKELVANVARYHRGSEPKEKHENFTRLRPDERRRVLAMAAVLRVAGGLDRSHSQQVRDVIVSTSPGQVRLDLISDQEPEADLWGARQRAPLFEKAFQTKLAIHWRPPVTADSSASTG